MGDALTKLQISALEWLAWQKEPQDPKQMSYGHPDVALRRTYRLWNGLLDRGLATGRDQTEQIRGERRTYWIEYSITAAGRAALRENGHG